MNVSRSAADPRRVYCAGPAFNAGERRQMADIAEGLRREGFTTFVPHADGLEFAKVQPVLIHWGHSPEAVGRLLHEAIFALNVYQVALGCGSLVLNLNGRVPDEGAVAESTTAWMLGKPVVIYKEDVRSLMAGRDHPLVIGQTGFEVVARLEQIGPALKAKIALLPKQCAGGAACPAGLAGPLEHGEQFWRRLETLGAARPAEEMARMTLELFAGYRPEESKLGMRRPAQPDGAAAQPKRVY